MTISPSVSEIFSDRVVVTWVVSDIACGVNASCGRELTLLSRIRGLSMCTCAS